MRADDPEAAVRALVGRERSVADGGPSGGF
jgi:hypothetical protein